MFACLQSFKALKMLGTTFRASDRGDLDGAHECTFLTSSQVMPVMSMLLVLHRDAAFSLFLLHKLPRPGLKLWTICVVPGVLTPIVGLIFQR